jgi:CDP-diacylglycerol---glycerol-3-phosphate 3-phosphatidyltransferase
MMGEESIQPTDPRVNRFLLGVANLLTLARLLATPVLVWVLLQTPGDRRFDWMAIGMIVALQATDVIDGVLARRARPPDAGRVNPTGEVLDPLADKLYINSAYITLMLLGRAPLWAGGVIVLRDVLILLGWLNAYLRQGVRLLPNALGKAADSLQALALLALLALPGHAASQSLLWLTFAATIASGLSYARLALSAPRHA